jgi:nicotinate-nucleotide adenylyltransferase
MRIAICGGTFDPFHRGHLEPIVAVRGAMGWDRVIYIPAYRQPFKLDRDAASGHHRFAMAVLATREDDALYVSPMELERGEVSYTVDTLEALRREHVEAELDWIIGEDNVADLPKWNGIERIHELARFVVLKRIVEEGQSSPSSTNPNIVYAANGTVEISATDIRRRVRGGESIDAFVDPLVARYIHHNGLYREATT